MNLLLIHETDLFSSNQAAIEGRRARHLIAVKQVAVGDRVYAGLLNGLMGVAVVENILGSRIELSLSLTEPAPAPLDVHLILSLCRPKMLRRILQTVSAMGVKKLTLINSARVEKSYWQTPWLKAENIRQQLILGLEQAEDTQLPQVKLEKRFKHYVEDRLPQLLDNSQALLAHPGTVMKCPGKVRGHVTLAVGPEGGYTSYEVEKLQQAGFSLCQLGQRILRVENAIPVLLGRLDWC